MAKDNVHRPIGAAEVCIKRCVGGWIVQLNTLRPTGPFENSGVVHVVFSDFVKMTDFLFQCFRAYDQSLEERGRVEQ